VNWDIGDFDFIVLTERKYMNLQKAIAILKNEGCQVRQMRDSDKYYTIAWGRGWEGMPGYQPEDTIYTAREIVNMAREYTSEGQNTPFKRSLKDGDKRKNRSATSQMISNEKWDDFPSKGKIKQDDIWNYD
jgi:hypothetical protein